MSDCQIPLVQAADVSQQGRGVASSATKMSYLPGRAWGFKETAQAYKAQMLEKGFGLFDIDVSPMQASH